jgi:hypothetical protein
MKSLLLKTFFHTTDFILLTCFILYNLADAIHRFLRHIPFQKFEFLNSNNLDYLRRKSGIFFISCEIKFRRKLMWCGTTLRILHPLSLKICSGNSEISTRLNPLAFGEWPGVRFSQPARGVLPVGAVHELPLHFRKKPLMQVDSI